MDQEPADKVSDGLIQTNIHTVLVFKCAVDVYWLFPHSVSMVRLILTSWLQLWTPLFGPVLATLWPPMYW